MLVDIMNHRRVIAVIGAHGFILHRHWNW